MRIKLEETLSVIATNHATMVQKACFAVHIGAVEDVLRVQCEKKSDAVSPVLFVGCLDGIAVARNPLAVKSQHMRVAVDLVQSKHALSSDAWLSNSKANPLFSQSSCDKDKQIINNSPTVSQRHIPVTAATFLKWRGLLRVGR